MLQRVQQKIYCVFETSVESTASCKRPNQSFFVQASDKLKEEFILQLKEPYIASEKFDGTCVLVNDFNGKPWLWARHDRKTNKKLKRTYTYGNKNINCVEKQNFDKIEFDIANYKDVPEHWVASNGCIDMLTREHFTDTNGYIMGWIPVNPLSRQHCWHSQAVDLESGLALTLKPKYDCEYLNNSLVLSLESLKELEGCSMELIGTNVNGNAYSIGSKKAPMHFLIRHGIMQIHDIPEIQFTTLHEWFTSNENGKIEGIVWHCSNKKMYKLHRHHMKVKWPIDNTKLSKRPIHINISTDRSTISNPYFKLIASLKNTYFDTLSELSQFFVDNYPHW